MGAAAAWADSPPSLALLAFEFRNRKLERLRQRSIQCREQLHCPQQLYQGGGLHRLPTLETLQRGLADPGLLGHFGLCSVSLQAVSLEPAPELGQHRVVG
jgi:hypothetical protein